MVAPKTVISVDRVNVVGTTKVGWEQFEGGWIRSKVYGEWVVALTINEPERFTFAMLEGRSVDAQEQGVTDVPGGSKIMVKRSVSVEFRNRTPYFVSPLAQEAFKFPDWAAEWSTDRYFPYIRTTRWKWFVAPYDVSYREEGNLIRDETVAFGPGELGWTMGMTYRIEGITFTNLGSLTGYDLPPGDLDLAAVRDRDGSGDRVFRVDDLRGALRDYDPPDWSWSSANLYKEFWDATALPSLSEAPEADKTFDVGLYEGGANYPDEVESLYSYELPKSGDYEDAHPSAQGTEEYRPLQGQTDSFTSFDRGGEYWFMEAGTYGFPVVTVEAPADKFNTVLWYPPSGDAEVLEVGDVSISEEGHGEALVKFRNSGDTPATFTVSVDPPESMFVVDVPSPVTLDPGQTATGTFTLGAETVSGDVSSSGRVTVTASRTNNSDSMGFQGTVKNIEPGEEPPPAGAGDVQGIVLSKATGEPIAGASVYTDTGQVSTTKSDGTFLIEDVPSQEVEITATAPGYESRTVHVDVVADDTVSTGAIMLAEKGKPVPWLWIILIGGVSAAAVGAVVYRYRRRISSRWRRRRSASSR